MFEIRKHDDGTQVLLDEPCNLKPNTKVIITVVEEDENADWYLLGKKS
jgi:stalled ribosome rescue protein Dom34